MVVDTGECMSFWYGQSRQARMLQTFFESLEDIGGLLKRLESFEPDTTALAMAIDAAASDFDLRTLKAFIITSRQPRMLREPFECLDD